MPRALLRVLPALALALAGASGQGCAAVSAVAELLPLVSGAPGTAAEAAVRTAMKASEKGPAPVPTALGWDVHVAAGRFAWRACASPTDCSASPREREADDVLALRPVGRARPVLSDGSVADETEVFELTLAPPPRIF